MDYSRIYINLIENSFSRKLDCYTEKHHIVPKCMGGDDKPRNIAILTPEEHYLAHQLLAKIYPDNKKLIYAACMMCGSKYAKRRNKLYGWLRRKLSGAMSERMTGNTFLKGKALSEETKLKISISKKGQPPPNKGMPMSKEQKIKLSLLKKGKPSNNKGKKASDETRKKLSLSHQGPRPYRLGFKHSEETKKRMSESKRKLNLIKKQAS